MTNYKINTQSPWLHDPLEVIPVLSPRTPQDASVRAQRFVHLRCIAKTCSTTLEKGKHKETRKKQEKTGGKIK